jgi:hypothetical protein
VVFLDLISGVKHELHNIFVARPPRLSRKISNGVERIARTVILANVTAQRLQQGSDWAV